MTVDLGESIVYFAINRPPPSYEGFPEFWQAIFEVMRQTPTYCILAGVRTHANHCVANPDILDELPADFAEERGGARFVTSAAEFEAALYE